MESTNSAPEPSKSQSRELIIYFVGTVMTRSHQSIHDLAYGISGSPRTRIPPGSMTTTLPSVRSRSIVSGSTQALGDHWRERVVDQKPHPAAASGSSRSRTASAA
jgi:hypothetical protein